MLMSSNFQQNLMLRGPVSPNWSSTNGLAATAQMFFQIHGQSLLVHKKCHLLLQDGAPQL